MKIDPYHACVTSTHLNRQWQIQGQGRICSAGRPWAIESLPAPFHKEEILSVSCECRSHSVTGKSCCRESNRNVLESLGWAHWHRIYQVIIYLTDNLGATNPVQVLKTTIFLSDDWLIDWSLAELQFYGHLPFWESLLM